MKDVEIRSLDFVLDRVRLGPAYFVYLYLLVYNIRVLSNLR